MEGFSYTNIFETKGIEYLIIIAFLFLIIPFWVILTRPKRVVSKVKRTSGALSHTSLKIPMGIFFSRNHTWAYLESTGIAKAGFDDFLIRVAGSVNIKFLGEEGQTILKGQPVAELEHNGRIMKVVSPLSGTIFQINPLFSGIPEDNENIDDSWIYRIRPADWKGETSHFFLAGEAAEWFKREVERFKEMVAAYSSESIPGNPLPVMQDGGELKDVALADLPDQAWLTFEKSFLTSEQQT